MKEHHVHSHHHPAHTSDLTGKKLLWISLLNISITLVQVIGGLISNSLSLLSDALHNLGDSSAILIAFFARKRSRKEPDERHTFGYKRMEILAALFNAIVLISICIFLFYEAWQRYNTPSPIKGELMFIVATFGLLANLFSVLILKNEKDHNLNTKAAYLHLMGDTLSSVAVIIGGMAIWIFEVFWLDPLITIAVGTYIIYHTWGIIKQSVDILMQTVPSNIHLNEIKKTVETINEVKNIHHIHVWKLDDTQTHFEAHINVKNNISMHEMMALKNKLEYILQQDYDIQHITLQMGYKCCEDDNTLIQR
ncbi:cation diffusion facilitator family transporter [Saccharicrinis fermentans]|nr:cation diffusion facilitator family transporter [Saccharicrinis fermentans]